MQKLKKYSAQTQDIWVTSDLHANHILEPVWRGRGFNSPQEHTDYIIQTINTYVKPDDLLFHLGDMTLNTSTEMFEDFIGKLNCKTIYTLWGNHPNPSKKIYTEAIKAKYGEDIEVYPFRYKNLVFLGHHHECMIGKKGVTMNHYPLRIWDYAKYGSFMLHGHQHCSDEISSPEYPVGKIMDVGFDSIKRPWNFKEILSIMEKKQCAAVGRH